MNRKSNIRVLPLDDAVELSCKENIERDQRVGVLPLAVSPEEKKLYLEEAREVLRLYGENFLPDYPDHHVIRVEGYVAK